MSVVSETQVPSCPKCSAPVRDWRPYTSCAACKEPFSAAFDAQMETLRAKDSAQASNSISDPQQIEDLYVNKQVGISRKALNVQAAIGIVVFGWLMKMNYDELGHKELGWAFLIAMAFVYALATQVEPMVGILAPVIYVAAWIHTNAILSKKQRLAREQYLRQKNT